MTLKVAIVDLEPALPNLSSQPLMPRHAVLAVATAARRAGHEVSVFVECLNGVPRERLHTFDVVGAPITVCCMSRVRSLFEDLRRRNPAIKLIAGGPHSTLIPTDALGFADVVVRDEGEQTFVDLLQAVEEGRELEAVSGISFHREGEIVHNPRRPFLEHPGLVEDLSLLEGFRRTSKLHQLLRRGGLYRIHAMASRGCPFSCTFCFENMIGGTGYRTACIDDFITDIRNKKELFGTRHVWLADANFAVRPEFCRTILEALIDADLGCRFSVPARVDIGEHEDVLALMGEAGFEWVALGLETIRDRQLREIDKGQTVAQMRSTIDKLHRHGMGVFGFFMLGFDDDTAATPHEIVDFCHDVGVDGVSFFFLIEYPSLPGRTLPRYRICEPDYDYYNGHFVVTFPLSVRPSELEEATFDALARFYSYGRGVSLLASGDLRGATIALPFAAQVRKLARISVRHRALLRERERRFYDRSGTLDESLLRRHPLITGPVPEFSLADWVDASEAASASSVSPVDA